MATETATVIVDDHEMTISNPSKVFFEEIGVTKLDLVNYYTTRATGPPPPMLSPRARRCCLGCESRRR